MFLSKIRSNIKCTEPKSVKMSSCVTIHGGVKIYNCFSLSDMTLY